MQPVFSSGRDRQEYPKSFNDPELRHQYSDPMKRIDYGIRVILDEMLIVVMAVVLAAVILMLIFGVVPFMEKTAYVVPRFSIVNISDKPVIAIFNRGGDPVYFNGSPQAKYNAGIYIDTGSGSYRAVPDPSLTIFRPGDLIIAYYSGSGFGLTRNLSQATFQSLPPGTITVRFIDMNSGILIAREDLVKETQPPAGSASPTDTMTISVPITTSPEQQR